VCLWMPMVAWGVVRLVRVLIDWRGRVGYERARAALMVDVLRIARTGVAVCECRADGTMLRIEVRADATVPSGAGEETRGMLC
jgi:hypothetical protein